jgi:hypothetical protein
MTTSPGADASAQPGGPGAEARGAPYTQNDKRANGRANAADLTAIMGEVARRLLGPPNAKLSNDRELRYGTKGSLSISLEKGVFKDFESDKGGGVLDLIERETGLTGAARFDWLRERGLIDDEPRPNRRRKGSGAATGKGNGRRKANGSNGAGEPRPEADDAKRKLTAAQRIAAESIDITGTPAEAYLRIRGIDIDKMALGMLSDLRFHPGSRKYPAAMVALVRSMSTGELTGSIHRTPITADGKRAMDKDGKPEVKKGLGKHGDGMACIGEVPKGAPMFIAEGIEDALTASSLTGTAAIATLGSGRLSKMTLEKGAQVVLLAQAKTKTDRQTWAKAARRFAASGVEVKVVSPRARGDINDLLTAEGAGAVQAAIANAKPVGIAGDATSDDAPDAPISEDNAAALAEMNERFAVVMIGGKTRVFSLEENPMSPGCKVPVFSTIADFCAFHKNPRKVVVGEAGRERRVGVGKWWIEHEGRRQYNGIVYAPGATTQGKLNLWNGYSCEPQPGDCSLYLKHLEENICGGNAEYYEYLLNWMARYVQFPGRQGEVAVVMRGREGVGKGIAAKVFGSLFGAHFRHISQPGHLTGHFNAHLQQCSVLFADEAFFAGDRSHESILKALITEETLMIEPKGVDPFQVQNCLHIMLSSNNDWVVPAGADARRYFVLTVADARMQDTAYFAAILEQMAKGGREALLDLLLKRDLVKFNVRAVPQTEALADQKARSRRGIDALIESMAQDGVLLAAHQRYANVALTTGETKGEGFFAEAKKLVPDLKYTSSTVIRRTLREQWGCKDWRGEARHRGIEFPALGELREAFDRMHGDQKWTETGEADWSRPPLEPGAYPDAGGE